MLLLGAVVVAVAVAFALAVAVASRELVSLNEAFHTLEREQRPVDRLSQALLLITLRRPHSA